MTTRTKRRPRPTALNTKPAWFHDHELSDIRRFTAQDTAIAELKALLVDEDGQLKFATRADMKPILDTYRTVGTMGTWGKASLAFIVTIVTLIIAAKTLLGR